MTNAIIVTGGAGFIGGNFILHWLSEAYGPVVNLDKLTYAGNPATLASVEHHPDYTFAHGDICDAALIADLLAKYQPRAIIHFAAESHVDRSILQPDEFLKTNIDGTFALLQAARNYVATLSEQDQKVFRFLHISTDEVYGTLDPNEPAFLETSPYAPNSPYAASKAASNLLARAWLKTYGLPVLVINCSNNFGPHQFPEKLIPLAITQALAGKPLPLYGDGLQVRDWLYVLDHCKAIVAVLDKGTIGETYNVGGCSQRNNLEVLQALCTLLDELIPNSPYKPHAQLITYVEDRPGHDRRYAIDTAKIEQEIGWLPEESFETGIRKTVEWYLGNKKWVDGVTSGDYQHWVAANYGNRTIEVSK